MKSRLGAVAWFITGLLIGFGGLALIGASLGMIALVPALAIGAILVLFRIRSAPMFLVGVGMGIAVPWGLHITSGDTPDDELWPVLMGLAVAVAGIFMLFRHRAAAAEQGSRASV